MAKYFLGSVGKAEAFSFKDNEQRLMFVASSLTDSGLNISTTKDELRGGTGAPIVANFYHDANVAITLTDVLFKDEYVEAQLGGTFTPNAKAYYNDTKIADDDGKVILDYEPQELELPCASNMVVVWISQAGKDEWKLAKDLGTFDTTDKKEFTFNDGAKVKGNTYCFRYVTDKISATELIVSSNIIPQELFLVITAPLFAGDACAASEGGLAGSITFEIPRFRLDGAQDFTLNMSSNTNMSLSGTAQAVANGCDINGSKLLRIIKVLADEKFSDGVKQVLLENETMAASDFATIGKDVFGLITDGKKNAVYGVKSNDTVVKIPADELKFTVAEGGQLAFDADGKITHAGAAGDEITVAVKEKEDTLFDKIILA